MAAAGLEVDLRVRVLHAGDVAVGVARRRSRTRGSTSAALAGFGLVTHLDDLVGDAAQEQVASLAADIGRPSPRSCRPAPAAPTRCTGRPSPESSYSVGVGARLIVRLFGLLMKLATSASWSIGNASSGPLLSVVLTRSLSIGWIRSSPWPGPTKMPKPPRNTVLPGRVGHRQARLEVVLLRAVQRRRVRIDRAGVDVELDDQVVLHLQRRVVVVAQAVVERQVRRACHSSCANSDVVLLLGVAHAGRAVVEDARRADVAEVLNRRRRVGQERGDVRERVGRAAQLVGRHPDQADVAAELHEVVAAHRRHRVGEGERVRVVEQAAAVGGAVGAHQAAGHDDARTSALWPAMPVLATEPLRLMVMR